MCTSDEVAVAGPVESMYGAEIQTGARADPMTKTVEEVIVELGAEIAADEAALRKKKETVNTLCSVVGRPPAYAIEGGASPLPTQIRSDQFYGQPLAASARTILEMRRAQNLGAATVADIYATLVAGGYEFETKSDEIARKSLRNSLAKNTALFHKLPNGQFGLVSWYPNAKKAKAGGQNAEVAADTQEADYSRPGADEFEEELPEFMK